MDEYFGTLRGCAAFHFKTTELKHLSLREESRGMKERREERGGERRGRGEERRGERRGDGGGEGGEGVVPLFLIP